MNDDTTFSINLDEDYLNDTGSEYTFNLTNDNDTITIDTIDWNNNLGTKHGDTFSIDTSSNSEFIYNTLDTYIDPDEIELMCKEYPALTKVWRNFKSVYDMVKQDYKGKQEAGEVDA